MISWCAEYWCWCACWCVPHMAYLCACQGHGAHGGGARSRWYLWYHLSVRIHDCRHGLRIPLMWWRCRVSCYSYSLDGVGGDVVEINHSLRTCMHGIDVGVEQGSSEAMCIAMVIGIALVVVPSLVLSLDSSLIWSQESLTIAIHLLYILLLMLLDDTPIPPWPR